MPPVLGHRFADLFPELSLPGRFARSVEPALIVLNEALVVDLGLDPAWLRSPAGLRTLVGAEAPAGATPVAMAYAGHQFGNYSSVLGDGRALLLGEIATDVGSVDLHLKGSGRTRFARGGDGKAVLGPMLREYLVGEAMHALGVPTTRALAVTSTGEQVLRDRPLPGAVLARIATSHLRVGTFELAARQGSVDLVARLVQESLKWHYPEQLTDDPMQAAYALLEAVVEAQAELIAGWMLVGFVHGVMNTDNMAISGVTIDYGPCALLDGYRPEAVFSSIDRGGRYAYGNQPGIALWNLNRFAETLLPQLDADPDRAVATATDLLGTFGTRYRDHWDRLVAAKLGLVEGQRAGALADNLLLAMTQAGADLTGTFRSLNGLIAIDAQAPAWLQSWLPGWRDALATEGRPESEVRAEMDSVNPIYIPRNHMVHEALTAAERGDLGPFHALLEVVTTPYDERPGAQRFTEPAPPGFTNGFQTFCGT